MVWLKHKNIEYKLVWLDPRPGGTVVRAHGTYLGVLGGPGFKSYGDNFFFTYTRSITCDFPVIFPV
jgi:hypothetical protein